MTVAVQAAAFVRPAAAWRRHGFVLAVAAGLLLALYAGDVATLVTLWWTSTTFGHCLFVAPVLGWLVWQRRAELARLDPCGWWPGLALVAVGGAGWLMGEVATVALARQLGVVMMLQGLVVTLLGPMVARGLAFPLGYAVFLVPFGEGLEAPLQRVTVAIVLPLLHLVGVPARVDGVLIHAGPYFFEVAEACSGAKFVIAMIAFGVLVAGTCFWSWRRRAGFMAAAIAVPVLANGLRAFATIYAAQLTSVEAATGFDHIVYGWVFFGLVMAATLALGWRWFDRAPDAPAFDPATLQATPRRRLDVLPAAALALAVAAVFPAWAHAIDTRAVTLPARIALPDVAGWQRAPLSRRAPWQPYYPGADHQLFGRYVDASGAKVDLAVALYGDQREGKELVRFGTGAVREEDRWVRVEDQAPLAGGSVLRITAPGPVDRLVVTWYRVGGHTTADETMVKIDTVRARLLGTDARAMALHLSVELRPGEDARAVVTRFLAALGPLDQAADRIAAGVR